MSLITVAAAEEMILSHKGSYGIETVTFDRAYGRILAEDIPADRNLPPYNRVTMDGIAISYAAFERGARAFRIKATMAAGDAPAEINNSDECIELMTGCAMPASTDTVVRYEDVEVTDGIATIVTESIRSGANVHREGSDKRAGDMVVRSGVMIDASVISMAASVGRAVLQVYKLPRVVIVSTGDELVDIDEEPGRYEIRRSNSYTIRSAISQYGIVAELLHIPDDQAATNAKLQTCLEQYDVVILSGGVSMGRFDFVPQALDELGVTRVFHKVAQRPGKPFWFGIHERSDTRIFAFPGNPVSAFLCLYRYFVPWLYASLGVASVPKGYAVLARDIEFRPLLQYFLQVHVGVNEKGQLQAVPVEGNGSGDFSNLLQANAFMELPAEQTAFRAGEVFRIWPFKQIIS